MSWFKKNSDEETPRPRNEKAMLLIRAVAAAYLLYMVYDMVQLYLKEQDPSKLWVVIGGGLFLAAGAIFIAIITWKDWKRLQQREAEEYLASLEAADGEPAAVEEEEEEPEVELDDDPPQTEPEELPETAEEEEETEDSETEE